MLRITLKRLNEVGNLLIQFIERCAAALANSTGIKVRVHYGSILDRAAK